MIYSNLVKSGQDSNQLLMHLIFEKIHESTSQASADERIVRVLNLIKQSEPAQLSIDVLAAAVCISPSRLRMQFKQSLGVPLHQYIIRHRLLSAVTDIINGNPIQDAAYKFGFTDSSHFHKVMSKQFAIGPSAFLKDNQTFSIVPDDGSFEFRTALAI